MASKFTWRVFLGGHFFGVFFGQVWENSGKKFFAHPKICLFLHLYDVEPAELFEIAVDREVFHLLPWMLLPQPSLEEKRA